MMTQPPPAATRPYSPGLEGVIAGETSLGYVDGERGRLLYRGYRIGDLVEHGTYRCGREPALDGRVGPHAPTGDRPDPGRGDDGPAGPPDATPSRWTRCGPRSRRGARPRTLPWPPTVEQARALTSFSPSALAAFARIRAGQEPIEPDPVARPGRGLPLPAQGRAARRRDGPGARRVLHRRRRARLQRLDVHGPGRHLDPLRHRVGGRRRDRHDEGAAPRRRAVGGRRPARPGRLGRPRRGVGPRGARPRRAADGLRPPRLPRLRPASGRAAQGRRGHASTSPTGSQLAIEVEDVALRVLAEKHPERPLKTNVEYYAAPVLMGVGLTPDLFPATFSLARHAGWTAHVLEQAADNRLIRPDVNYVGPAERDLPA